MEDKNIDEVDISFDDLDDLFSDETELDIPVDDLDDECKGEE
jgi:hypothetical protein